MSDEKASFNSGSPSAPTPELLHILNSLGSAVRYPKGADIYAEGDPVDWVYVLEDGELGLFSMDTEGNEVCIGFRKQWWLVGAACLLPRKPSPACVRTLSHCKLRQYPVPRFLDAIAQHKVISAWMLEALSRELHEQITATSLVALQDLSKRLQHFIWTLTAACPPGKCKLQWPFGQKTVARSLSTSESYLSTKLTELETRGIIKRNDGWLCVPDRSKLWHRFQQETDCSRLTAP